ncbi:hypothetical protein [Spirosoma endophyticum]|uniref:Uncharacterized protein n=1 Tax=Spirosoma endophyticum TaxID=662367 RepID=A0A1I1ZDP0_9BACT|nr:hypothetical protein [Spirosoma endophyticum]SFE29871.1 hypothetical protein SAMN05216167_11291 [Spirosoma endophyticum]
MNLFFKLCWFGIVFSSSSGLNSVYAQQPYIPGVTDISSVTTLSNLSAKEFRLFVQKGCQDSSHFAMERHEWVGQVHYRGDLQAYVIVYGEPNTFDTERTGVVCNLANAKDWLVKTVTFSGRYFHASGIKPQHGGDHNYYLYVTAIRAGGR